MPFILAYGSPPFASTVKLGLVVVSFATMVNIPHNTHCDRLPSNLETLLTVLWSYTTFKTDPWMTRKKEALDFCGECLRYLDGVVKRQTEKLSKHGLVWISI